MPEGDSMEAIKKVVVTKLDADHPARERGCEYNVQVLTSIDGGETFFYCGIGRFVKDISEAERYALMI